MTTTIDLEARALPLPLPAGGFHHQAHQLSWMRCGLLILAASLGGCLAPGDEPSSSRTASGPIPDNAGEGSEATSELAVAACDGTSGQWSGCRGHGCAVCAEKVGAYPGYVANHPACEKNNACAGSFFTCNANCPAPADADRAVPVDATLLSHCTGSNPIKCAVPVATNGNYNVTVETGSSTQVTASRVQAETYRIQVPTTPARTGVQKNTFTVNVRTELHDGYSAPGMILNLIIDGPTPALRALGVAPVAQTPTIFIVGDSTVCDWDPAFPAIPDPAMRGWGQELSQHFKPGIAVANHADSGESAATHYSKFFPPARDAMRAGDYLFIQFGHVDQKSQTTIDNFVANLRRYIGDAKGKGAIPVLFTPVARKNATLTNTLFEGLDQRVRDLAASDQVALVDLTTLSINHYKTVSNPSTLFAKNDSMNLSEAGATAVASLVAKALKAGSLPVKSFVK